MIDDGALNDLRHALDKLETARQSACPWESLPSLARLDAAGYRIQIDLAATSNLGAPLVILHPGTPDFATLSPRQREVAEALRQGKSNAEIARDMNISIATVKDHVHAVLSKLGLRRRAEINAPGALPGQ